MSQNNEDYAYAFCKVNEFYSFLWHVLLFFAFKPFAVRFLRINLASLNAGTMQLLAIANKVGCPVAVLTRRYLEFLYFM